MKMDDIFEKTMEKLHKQLVEITIEFKNNNDDNFSLDCLNSFLTVANRKIVNYRKNIDIKEGTNNFIKEICINILLSNNFILIYVLIFLFAFFLMIVCILFDKLFQKLIKPVENLLLFLWSKIEAKYLSLIN